jgi:hypothetical protein
MVAVLIFALVVVVALVLLSVSRFEIIWFRKPPEPPLLPEPESEGEGPYRLSGEVPDESEVEVIANKLITCNPERTSEDGDRLTDYELEMVRKNVCPDCEHEGFLGGPCGGMAQNIKCANDECGSRFNDLGMFGVDRISGVSSDRRRDG